MDVLLCNRRFTNRLVDMTNGYDRKKDLSSLEAIEGELKDLHSCLYHVNKELEEELRTSSPTETDNDGTVKASIVGGMMNLALNVASNSMAPQNNKKSIQSLWQKALDAGKQAADNHKKERSFRASDVDIQYITGEKSARFVGFVIHGFMTSDEKDVSSIWEGFASTRDMILYRVTWPTGSVQSWETFLDHQPDKQWYAKLPSNPWHVAQDKTKQVGKVLARLLLKQMEVAKNRKVVLIGHSLGAAITFQTMLQASDDDSAGVADYVIFLGGAFSPTKDELEILLKKVSCQVFNFYNKEDQVLKIALRAVSLKVEPAAGNIPLAMSQQILGSKLLNFDMTGTIIVDHSTQYGHSYRDVLSLIAEKLQDILI